MKKIFFLLIVSCRFGYSFEPICFNPIDIKKTDIQEIFKSEEAQKDESNQLIVYSVNPPRPIDWSTPGTLMKSIFNNSFISETYKETEEDGDGHLETYDVKMRTHFIGHMFIGLKCKGYPAILTGMTSPGTEEISGLLLEGKSFSQVIRPTAGHFNTAEELESEIQLRKTKAGNLSFMGINLRQNSCEELLKYLTEFKSCGVDKRYGGLNANPHKAEGAGCSAFALSFLQRLNIMPMIKEMGEESFGKQFVRKINVPKNMLIQKNVEPEIGAWGLLRGNKIQWASDNIKGREVVFFDPELFSSWVRRFDSKEKISGIKFVKKDENKLINGLWFEEDNLDLEQSIYSLDYLESKE